jgi:mono/diheme cytochrome c family protein
MTALARNGLMAGLAASLALIAMAVAAQEATRIFSSGYRFVEMSGEELYNNVCRGCHMMDGQGASGAGSYPSLASNPKLDQAGYPVALVVRGRRAMPPFGDMMNDAQVAAVVNYLRTHFGNTFGDVVTEQDVSEARR